MSGLFAPPQASTIAGQVDALVLFMVIGSALISLTIFACIVFFAIRYRRRPGNELAGRVTRTLPIEIAWTIVPLVVAMIPFVWGAKLYVDSAQPPADAQEVYVVAQAVDVEGRASGGSVGDQRAARAGGPAGQTDDDLAGRDPQLLRARLSAQGGRLAGPLHHVVVPANRGRASTSCCVPSIAAPTHSHMLGQVVVMRPTDYADWLTSGATASQPGRRAGPPALPAVRLHRLP